MGKKVLNFKTPKKKITRTPFKAVKISQKNSSEEDFSIEEDKKGGNIEITRKSNTQKLRKRGRPVKDKKLPESNKEDSSVSASSEENFINSQNLIENNFINIENIKLEKELIENSLISNLREENYLLRNLKEDAFIYSKLLGITINEDKEAKELLIIIEKNNSGEEEGGLENKKRLSFILSEKKNGNYHYFLKENLNCGSLGNFENEIEFRKKETQKFFFHMTSFVHQNNNSN